MFDVSKKWVISNLYSNSFFPTFLILHIWFILWILAFAEMSQYYKHIRTAHTAVEEENTKHSKAGEESVETHIVVVEPTSSAVEGTLQILHTYIIL